MPVRTRDDRMTLCGIRLRPRIGVTPGERRQSQPCEADVTVWGNFEGAAAADALDQAMDYSIVLARVFEVAHSREYNLLETLAYRLAKEVLHASHARRVGVRIRKRPASLREKIDYVEVEVEEG